MPGLLCRNAVTFVESCPAKRPSALSVALYLLLYIPGDAIKRDPERENCAVLTIAAQTANSIHIRVTFNAVTRYVSLHID